MFNIPAITWTLTAVLLLSGSYHVLQATKSYQLMDQINKSLHALMSVLMTAMLWNLVPSTMLAQIAVLSAAALWFVIQAVARPEFKTLCRGSQGRLKCLYHSLTMVGAALMVAMMAGNVSPASQEAVPTGGMSNSHAHHMMPAQSAAAAAFDQSSSVAILLTVFFGAAAAVFLVLVVRFPVTKTAHHGEGVPRHSLRTEHGLEAIGAAVMALMFATMSA